MKAAVMLSAIVVLLAPGESRAIDVHPNTAPLSVSVEWKLSGGMTARDLEQLDSAVRLAFDFAPKTRLVGAGEQAAAHARVAVERRGRAYEGTITLVGSGSESPYMVIRVTGSAGASPRALGFQVADEVLRHHGQPWGFAARIAAVRATDGGRQLVLTDMSGREVTTLWPVQGQPEDPLTSSPAWAPSGREFLFVGSRDLARALWRYDLRTGEVTRLPVSGDLVSSPAWSPDGSRIAFALYADGNGDVYTADRDGGSVSRLTFDRAIDGLPAWSPRGDRIAFISGRSGLPQAFVMDATGGNQRRLTFDAGQEIQSVAWGPRGLLALAARDSGAFSVGLVSETGSVVTSSTPPAGCIEFEPSFGPGGLLVFTRQCGSRSRLVVSTLDRSVEREISVDGLQMPAVQPIPASGGAAR